MQANKGHWRESFANDQMTDVQKERNTYKLWNEIFNIIKKAIEIRQERHYEYHLSIKINFYYFNT